MRALPVWHTAKVCMRTCVAWHYPCGMGKRTSIYLPDHLADAVKASGLTLGAHIRRSLESGTDEDRLRRIVREELADALGRTAASPASVQAGSEEERHAEHVQEASAGPCDHRLPRGAWCKECSAAKP